VAQHLRTAARKDRGALGPLATRIEHVGSTAAPGLAAKPIIDIDLVIDSWADLPTPPRSSSPVRPLVA
jgi:GrpB-like predicted nucleotidyltransferase (UPF0157 family)